MKYFAQLLTLPLLAVSIVGCLKTRGDLRSSDQQGYVPQQQTATLQKEEVSSSSKLADLEEQVRLLNGRVEEYENIIKTKESQEVEQSKNQAVKSGDVEQTLKAYQEALVKMEGQITQLNAELQVMRAEKAQAQAQQMAATATKESKSANKNVYTEAQSHFEKKDWKQAILSYQKYRDEYPKGKNFPEATYRIGVSFQELGMKDEAKTFFDEVLAKFPTSDAARKAKIRMKSLK